METINSHGRSKTSPYVFFEIAPEDISGVVTYTYGGHTYTYREGTKDPGHTETNDSLSYPDNESDQRYVSYHVSTNTSINMTAKIMPENVAVLEWRWDFGDGTVGYGPEVAHEWITASPETYVRLTATLIDGRKFHCNQLMNLKGGYKVVATPIPASRANAYIAPPGVFADQGNLVDTNIHIVS